MGVELIIKMPIDECISFTIYHILFGVITMFLDGEISVQPTKSPVT
jgi:hypothetical protein